MRDSDFSEAGAKIAYTTEEVYKADIVLKVAPPSFEELKYLQTRQYLISILQMVCRILITSKPYLQKNYGYRL
ncbi:MAG: hypothetical protein U0X76_09180 [Bacteroidia bacterium]